MGRDLGVEEVKQINDFGTGGLEPDLTIFLDLDPAVGLARIEKERAGQEDRLEQEKLEFHNKVYAGYSELLKLYPDRIKRVDANLPIKDVAANSVKIIRKQLPDIFM